LDSDLNAPLKIKLPSCMAYANAPHVGNHWVRSLTFKKYVEKDWADDNNIDLLGYKANEECQVFPESNIIAFFVIKCVDRRVLI